VSARWVALEIVNETNGDQHASRTLGHPRVISPHDETICNCATAIKIVTAKEAEGCYSKKFLQVSHITTRLLAAKLSGQWFTLLNSERKG